MDTTKQHFRIDRRYQRVATEMGCEVNGLEGGEHLSASILNLSAGGLKLKCGLQVINSILPADQRTPGQILNVELDIRFSLPQADGALVPVGVHASVVHSERLAQDEFHVGVQFQDADADVIRQLEGYISRMLEREPF